MAREVLDVQNYPDLRQYPGGPPERPYDAAGWTLPLQMGVKVVSAATPLTDEARAKMKPLGAPPDPKVKPTPYDAGAARPTRRRSTACRASASTPTPPPPRSCRRRDASPGADRRSPSIRPQNNAFRAINRAWKQGATVQFGAGRPATPMRATCISGLAEAAQDDLVNVARACRPSARSPRRRERSRQPRIGLYQPWTGSMDEGWTRWVLEQYGFEFTSSTPRTSRSPLASKIDVLILADDARMPVAGAPAGGRGGFPAAAAAARARSGRSTRTS